MKPTILVSACLVGVACTHRAEAKTDPSVQALSATHRLVAVCPEVAGGLPTPRLAAERGPDGRVRSADGRDLTDLYIRGARQAVAIARAAGAERAVLKARSPSCGAHGIYDGTHTKTLVAGLGVTAEALVAAGFEVVSEEDLRSPAEPDGAAPG